MRFSLEKTPSSELRSEDTIHSSQEKKTEMEPSEVDRHLLDKDAASHVVYTISLDDPSVKRAMEDPAFHILKHYSVATKAKRKAIIANLLEPGAIQRNFMKCNREEATKLVYSINYEEYGQVELAIIVLQLGELLKDIAPEEPEGRAIRNVIQECRYKESIKRRKSTTPAKKKKEELTNDDDMDLLSNGLTDLTFVEKENKRLLKELEATQYVAEKEKRRRSIAEDMLEQALSPSQVSPLKKSAKAASHQKTARQEKNPPYSENPQVVASVPYSSSANKTRSYESSAGQDNPTSSYFKNEVSQVRNQQVPSAKSQTPKTMFPQSNTIRPTNAPPPPTYTNHAAQVGSRHYSNGYHHHVPNYQAPPFNSSVKTLFPESPAAPTTRHDNSPAPWYHPQAEGNFVKSWYDQHGPHHYVSPMKSTTLFPPSKAGPQYGTASCSYDKKKQPAAAQQAPGKHHHGGLFHDDHLQDSTFHRRNEPKFSGGSLFD